VNPTAVIQVKRGIGDVIWHLPFIRAIAAVSPGGKVTFLAPTSSHAKELLAAQPYIAETRYFEHTGSELTRIVHQFQLVRLLRQGHFRTIWILDRTIRPALAAMLASIPVRIGVGLTRQRLFITNSGIDQSHYYDHPIDWLRALMAAMHVPLSSTEPDLQVSAAAIAAIGEKFSACARPWIVLGIGASHPARDWPDGHWVEFLTSLRQRTDGTIFLIGGSENAARAQILIGHGAGATAINACDLALREALALLHHADLFVGTDSGPMNLAAAVATPTFGLFGVNRALSYSKYIHPITPPGGLSPDGMQQISPAQVLERIAPHLS